MDRVVMWIERKAEPGEPVEIEQHVRPLYRWVRGEDGKPLVKPSGRPMEDTAYAERVYELVGGYNGENARDVALDLDAASIRKDDTGALRMLALTLREIGERVVKRQQRAEADKLRAVWLADFELAQMVVRVRAE